MLEKLIIRLPEIMPELCKLGHGAGVPEWWRCIGMTHDHRGPHRNIYGQPFTTAEAQQAGVRQ